MSLTAPTLPEVEGGPPGVPAQPFTRLTRGQFVPKTLGTRLALTYSGLVVLVMTVLGWALAQTIRDAFLEQLQHDLAGETIVVGRLLAPLLDSTAEGDALGTVARQIGAALPARVTVVDGDGTVLADSLQDPKTMENHAGRLEIQSALRSGSGTSLRFSSTMNEEYSFAARRIDNTSAVIRLGVSLAVLDPLVADVQRKIAVAALIAAALMTGAGWFVAHRIGEALEAIRHQAAAVAVGRFDVAVEPVLTQELGDLGRAFNAMTGQMHETLAELERVRTRLEATLANLSDGVVITNDRGHVVLANQAALTMLAVRGEVRNQPFVEVARDHELTEMVGLALSDPRAVAERVIRHGQSRRVLQAAVRSLDAAEERIGLVVLRDVTELRRLEGVRRDFVANVSHELRTPLTSIRALVETLEAGAIDDPDVSSDFLARIVSEVDRLALLVDELLDLARLESGRLQLALEPVTPESLMRRAMERMSPQTERANLTVELDLSPRLPAVIADRGRIDQVLLNLVHNAIKFTPSGGDVNLTATTVGAAVEFRVRDTGVGVNPEDLPRLFERFFKADRARRSQGTGLGLAIAKHIVLAHGGEIWAEANPDRGTTFVFTLPVAGPAADDGHAAAEPLVLAASGSGIERVLEPVTEDIEGEDRQGQR